MKKLLILLAALIVFNCSNKQDEIKELSVGGSNSIPEIAKFLQDPDMAVRKSAATALSEIGSEQSLIYLKEYRNLAKQSEEIVFANEMMKSVQSKMTPNKPKFVERAVNDSDPLETQVQNFIHNFVFKDGVGYGPKDEFIVEVKGTTVINYTDMTDFYNNTKRIKDWKTFYEYVKRTVLGFPTGDITAAVFEKFPQVTKFNEVAFVGENPEKDKDGKVLSYGKRKPIGKCGITSAAFKKIDPNTKEYLDKLSVSQQHFDKFEEEVQKFVSGVWYDQTVETNAKKQVSVGVE